MLWPVEYGGDDSVVFQDGSSEALGLPLGLLQSSLLECSCHVERNPVPMAGHRFPSQQQSLISQPAVSTKCWPWGKPSYKPIPVDSWDHLCSSYCLTATIWKILNRFRVLSTHKTKRLSNHYYFQLLHFGIVYCVAIDNQNRPVEGSRWIEGSTIYKRDIVSQDREIAVLNRALSSKCHSFIWSNLEGIAFPYNINKVTKIKLLKNWDSYLVVV